MESVRSFFRSMHLKPQYSGQALGMTLVSTFFIALKILQNIAPTKSLLYLFQDPVMKQGEINRVSLVNQLKMDKRNFSSEEIERILQEVKESHEAITQKFALWQKEKDFSLYKMPTLCFTMKGDPEGVYIGSHGKRMSAIISLPLKWLSATVATHNIDSAHRRGFLDSRQRDFVLLRNIAHIRQQSAWKEMATDISPLAVAPLSFFPGLWPIALLAEAVDILAIIVLGSVISRYNHRKADQKAAAYSPDVRRGGVELLERKRQKNLRLIGKATHSITRTWHKIWTKPDGSDRINWSNRSSAVRIKDLSQNGGKA